MPENDYRWALEGFGELGLEGDDQAGKALRWVALFGRGEGIYGVDVGLVQEVVRGQGVTEVPRSPEMLVGVMNLRGEVVPVVLVDLWLDLPLMGHSEGKPVMVLRDGDFLVGMEVDGVFRVAGIPEEGILAHPKGGGEKCFGGIWVPEGQAAVTLVDGGRLFELMRNRFEARGI